MTQRPLSLEAIPVQSTLVPAGDTQEYVLLRIRAVAEATGQRPRLAAVLVLDTSGSMAGEPLAQVIQSTQRLIEILGDDDALGVVAFDNGARTVAPMRKLDAAARAAARREVGTLRADGGTNMAGGLAHAALLFPARPPGERHIALLMSDGQPNIGADTPAGLADQVRLIRARAVAVSTLGFSASHNDDVLIAISEAGGGRYAFVDDPRLAGATFARALGAQRDVVAEDVRLLLTPTEGVEIVRVLGAPPMSYSTGGLRVTLEDLIAGDELNVVVELKVRAPRETGPWRPLKLTLGCRVAGTRDEAQVRGEVAVTLSHHGPGAQDETALCAVAIAFADEMRTEARGIADRGNYVAAAAVLRKAKQMIEGTPGFVTGGKGPLNDAAETLIDEIAAMEAAPDRERYQAFKRASRDYADFATGGTRTRGSVQQSPSASMLAQRLYANLPLAQLVVAGGAHVGHVYPLLGDACIGRSSENAVVVEDALTTRRHARVVFVEGSYWVIDLGSSNGTFVNERRVDRHLLTNGDLIRVGGILLRYEQK